MNSRYIRLRYTVNDQTYSYDSLPIADHTLKYLHLSVTEENVSGRAMMELILYPKPLTEISIVECTLYVSIENSNVVSCFSNGFQSWTESREFLPNETIKPLFPIASLYNIQQFGDYHFHHYPKGRGRFFSYMYSYLRYPSNRIDFIGSLDESKGYTIIDIDVKKGELAVKKECEGMVLSAPVSIFTLVFLEGACAATLDSYWQLVDDKTDTHRSSHYSHLGVLTGWTSWYRFYTDICEQSIKENLEACSRSGSPLDVFQIDDGYQQAVGDWLSIKKTFPNGMRYLADEIKAKGFVPGIWIAPFICERRSELRRNHPEWLLQDEKGKPIPAAWNPSWSGTFYGLNIFNAEFREYLHHVLHTLTVHWGFSLLKLDFLYAAALIPHTGMNRGQIMREAIKLLRTFAGDRTILIGCGVPLGSAVGYFDICRIGSDVGPFWEDPVLRCIRYRERVSTFNSLQSTIARYHSGGNVFLNDPDVFFLRSEENRLTRAQKFTLLVVNCLFAQVLFTSDRIDRYTDSEHTLYTSLFPVVRPDIEAVDMLAKHVYSVVFAISGLCYRAVINLNAAPFQTYLPTGYYFERSYTFDRDTFVGGGEKVDIPAYTLRLLLHIPEAPYTIAGSSGHLFPGADIEQPVLKQRSISVSKRKDSIRKTNPYIRVPGAGSYVVNGADVEASSPLEGLWLVLSPPL